MRAVLDRIRRARPLSGEQGLTMIEVVIAALVLTMGALATLSLVSTQAHNTYRGEQSQVVSNRLQEEMEKIKQLPYNQIALTGVPTDTTNTADPSWRTSGTSFAVAKDGSQLRSLVYNGSSLVGGGTVSGGAISPAPEAFSSGDASGTIYRFVTWENDPNCPEASCPGAQDMKRVIVAIRFDATSPGGTRAYQELQSQVADPEARVGGSPGGGGGGGGCTTNCGGGGGGGTPWTFFLTDTPTGCGNSDRQPITGDHLVHNTNGACGNAVKNSSNCTTVLLVTSCPPGPPDLMVTHAPPLTGETPLWDYATDVEPTTNANLDKGLQMPRPASSGCLSSLFQPLTNATGALIGDPSATRMQEIHKWTSNQMGNGFNVILDGRGTLNLWTQSINGASYTGKICIWLFERHLNLLGVPVDTPAVNLDLGNLTYFTYQPASGIWPTTWTELHIPLHFNLGVNLGPTSRLGLAIQVERSGTSGGGLQFMYDEPSFDSRLEVTTTGLLPF